MAIFTFEKTPINVSVHIDGIYYGCFSSLFCLHFFSRFGAVDDAFVCFLFLAAFFPSTAVVVWHFSFFIGQFTTNISIYLHIFVIFALTVMARREREYEHFHECTNFWFLFQYACQSFIPFEWLWRFLRITHFQRKLLCVILKRANDVRFQNDDVAVVAAAAAVVVVVHI